MVERRGDFEGESIRPISLIGAVKRNLGANRRLPINPEMLPMERAKLNLNTPIGSGKRGAFMFGIHFPLMIGAIGGLVDCDITFETVDGQPCVTVHFRASQTDQCEVGAHRTLAMAGGTLCPATGIA